MFREILKCSSEMFLFLFVFLAPLCVRLVLSRSFGGCTTIALLILSLPQSTGGRSSYIYMHARTLHYAVPPDGFSFFDYSPYRFKSFLSVPLSLFSRSRNIWGVSSLRTGTIGFCLGDVDLVESLLRLQLFT